VATQALYHIRKTETIYISLDISHCDRPIPE